MTWSRAIAWSVTLVILVYISALMIGLVGGLHFALPGIGLVESTDAGGRLVTHLYFNLLPAVAIVGATAAILRVVTRARENDVASDR